MTEPRLTAHAERNREIWNRESDAYEGRNAGALSGERAMAWGLFRRPESELKVLGEVSGKDVLELGCGAARWSIALAQRGARTTGLDLSERQLAHARAQAAASGVSLRLVEASAESLPFENAAFDVVFCDFGAMTFADPHLSVPQVARVLRPGGLLAFSTHSPLAALTLDDRTGTYGDRLVRDYFGLHALQDSDGLTEFHLTYGDWIALFAAHGMTVERLIELAAPPDAVSPYRTAEETAWARRWPMEVIWCARARG